jgi:LDH2 family malate/lactate/ureidoglycolate dehydrogenase
MATGLLAASGLSNDKARAVAQILVEADLMGHDTHGLNLLALYLGELESGSMTREGDPEVLADLAAAVTWDGRRLPGPWLIVMAMAMALAQERARRCGTGTVVIRRSHHTACLAAYLKRATDAGWLRSCRRWSPGAASSASRCRSRLRAPAHESSDGRSLQRAAARACIGIRRALLR